MNHLIIEQFAPLSYAGAEAINTLCTNLSFSGENIKRIMITSSHASEGKSFISMNLIRTMAKIGKNVALVDADLRRSMIASKYRLKFANKERAPGLAHFLAGMAEKEQIIYETNIPGAWMVPVGREVTNPLPLLNSGRLNTLLDYLARKIDYVIVDAPPLGVVIDAAQIAKFCDGAVVVVDCNTVRRQELIDVKNQLVQTGCPILGAVMNRVEFGNYISRKYYYKTKYSGYYNNYYAADTGTQGKKKISRSKKTARAAKK